ncbi:hypothetical protein BDV32DRAFT_146510 [Aspergillus pseudonomiae]|uniref:Uncharacterized protein n=1 Tax=Aspergillus pseudonomiae TaxID=1506151 RepID=A0A5N7DQ38_9EURO|nr:uncharacterized protein BDV37DRAFT_279046 [Aspergillus pseudonomiae]KAB8263694.1 hypothetical protein BDV32DRAFT_146510 [Aspergillus pseudonomiae]KAE8408561.1 hypothetical protein BDV37DRAFT_279046 [Aspergillus pseudonomiae]
MAFEAMEQWEADWRKYFHRSGLAMVARSSSYSCIDGCKRTLDGFGETVEPFHGSEDVRQIYPTFNDDPVCGYRNKDAGWVDSGFVMKDLVYQCVCSGVSFVTGPMGTVSSLVLSTGHAHGRWE